MERIRNEQIKGTAKVEWCRDKLREARLRWVGHVQSRDSGYIGQMILNLELPGWRKSITEKTDGCCEGVHAGGWCNRIG